MGYRFLIDKDFAKEDRIMCRCSAAQVHFPTSLPRCRRSAAKGEKSDLCRGNLLTNAVQLSEPAPRPLRRKDDLNDRTHCCIC